MWQATPIKKGERAAHNRRKPKPFVPPFMQKKAETDAINKDAEAMTVDDVKSWLSVPRG